MNTRLLGLATVALLIACEGPRTPTGPGAPNDPSKIISDGAHCANTGTLGCNPDFLWLPPMVPLPLNNPNFELGKFDNSLRTGLRVEICELAQTTGLPASDTPCNGGPIKTFPQGTVQLVNLPLRQNGWWTLFGLPADGFYYVLWDTRQSNLSVSKYYRIFVYADGMTSALGVADVDPLSSLREWSFTRTGQVIQLVDDVMLPISFRVEKGALCTGASLCTSAVVTNGNPGDPPQIVRVQGGAGPLAGALFPQGWLPAGGPQSVVVTIRRINTGINDVAAGTQSLPCHAGLNLQQFDGCFEFTTTPKLAEISPGVQFAKPVTVAVCYVLQDKSPADPREKFAEMYASGVGEPPHALADASDAAILTSPQARNCNQTPDIITQSNQGGLTGLASAGWNRIKAGLNKAFGVKTAYAVDLGLGGIATAFSRIGPAVSATIQPISATSFTVSSGSLAAFHGFALHVRAVGADHHNTGPPTTGLGGIPVVFSVTSGNGYLTSTTSADQLSQLTSATDPSAIDESLPNSTGHADVNWFVPNVAGTYTMTASSQTALGGPITYTVSVIADRTMLSMQTGASFQLSAPAGTVATWSSTAPAKVQVDATGLVTAIVGGENVNGGDGATLTLRLNGAAPSRMWLVNTPFDLSPRVTTAVWNPVAGAATYDIAIDYGNGCGVYASNCAWTNQGVDATGLTALNYTFTFVGTQPGRWRITARDASGAPIGDPSPYVYFRYIDGL